MSFEEKDLTGDITGLGPFEIDALQDWEYKFMTKYTKVGTIKKTIPRRGCTTCRDTSEGANNDAAKTVEGLIQRKQIESVQRA
ncbi:hypothetical protein IFM89_016067 [Coptis chinensis]|uniref:Uncharacterized protein n=1 Tax=Coptis chinensis TaxID=261450 RepID=A0A835ICI5_9MAGN|nr:hypothetical protein IFM89_016067 [Coptis chinensis]